MPTQSHDSLDRETRLDEIILAYLTAADAGQTPDRLQWLAQHAEFGPELQQFFADQDRLEQMAAPLRGAVETAPQNPAETETPPPPGSPPETVERQREGSDGSAPLPLPALGNYQLLSVIARGGMGVVFRARQKNPDRLVAVKMIHAARLASAADVQRFRNEGETVASLDHPNIVPIYEVAEYQAEDGSLPVLFFSMKLMEGGSLALAVASGQRLATSQQKQREAAELVATIARAVHHAHQRGILHRDLKPANILFDAAGRPHVTDFGLAKRLASPGRESGEALTESGALIGTPSYMAPELASFSRDPKGSAPTATTAADVYGLGAILYFVLAGRPPFEADMLLETLDLVRRREPVPPSRFQPTLDRDLETICLKCLQKEPQKRYGSAEALAEDLERWRRGEPILARPVGRIERAWRWCRRNPHLALAGTAVVAALLIGTIISTIFAIRADRAADLARQRSQLAEARLAEQYLDRALSACLDETDPGRGLHWLLLALESCPEDRTDLERVIRISLDAWRHQVPRLQAIPTTPGSIRCAALSRDGQYFATGGEDKTARLWDVAGRKPMGPPLEHPGIVLAVAFSPDGKKLVTGCADGAARLWEVPSGRALASPFQHGAPVRAVAFCPDGKMVLTAGQTARLWHADTGRAFGEPLPHQGLIQSAAFSPNGKTLLTLGNENIARLWDLDTKKPALLHSNTWTNAGAFSPDQRTILTGNDDHTARLWDAATLQSIRVFPHQGAVTAVTFDLDGRIALTGSADYTARMWDSATGRPLASPLRHMGGVNGLAFAPDGRTLWTAGGDVAGAFGEIRVWQMIPEPVVPFSPSEHALIKSVAFSPDGNQIVTGNEDGHADIWSMPSTSSRTDFQSVRPGDLESRPTNLMRLNHSRGVDAVAFHPDGRTVLTAGIDGIGRLWDAVTGRPIGQEMRDAQRIRSAVFSPDGKMIFIGGADGDPNPTSPGPSPGRAGRGRRGNDDYEAKLWSTSTQEAIGLPLLHPHAVCSVAFSPDGTKIATSRARDYVTQVWDVATRQKVGPPLMCHKGWVWSMAFSPDSKKLLTGSIDYTAQQWDVATGQPIGPPLKHPSKVWGVSYSPDDKIILTGCIDGAARLWDANTGKPLGPPLWHPGPVGCVAFHPDGQSFATGSSDNGVRVWAIPSPLAGSVDQLRLKVQVATGFEMDTLGGITVLNSAAWQKLRQRLQDSTGD